MMALRVRRDRQWMMSPGSAGATITSPGPLLAVNVLMKNALAAQDRALQPAEQAALRLRHDLDAAGHPGHRAGLGLQRRHPGSSLTVAMANDGLNWISTLSTLNLL